MFIQTMDNKWLEKALDCYVNKIPFQFLDDANIGIISDDLVSALALIRKARDSGALAWREICAILTGIGMSGIGIWMIVAAIADPDPTSKLAILLAGGVVMALTGSLSILWTLGHKWRVAAKAGNATIAVEPI